MLVDACRAVGVPARFVGTPLWSDKSGNHSWVEVWDDGWHFTGAAEPSGDKLDAVWFLGRASAAKRDDPRHAIYAVSYQKTPLKFPLVWDRQADYVHAVNVTDRYVARGVKPPAGTVAAMFRVLDGAEDRRCRAGLTILDPNGKVVFEGSTNDEGFDANDHLTAHLPPGGPYRAELRLGERRRTEEFHVENREGTFTWRFGEAAGEVGE
jgi:hypothetical protein